MPSRSILACLLLTAACRAAADADPALLWSTKVQPLFDVQCVKCHGPIEQKSGLELDTPEAVMKGGDEGAVIVPGKPEESRLYLNLAPGADPHMPPKKQLTEAERAVVREWIVALGQSSGDTAADSEAVREFSSVTEAIDTLMAESWNRERVQPAPPAEERAWHRRVYLDLVGRIPTAEEWAQFRQEESAAKRSALVDRLLESQEHAVRMRELWDVFLLGRAKRERHETRRQENGWWTYLEASFQANRPWNDVVREILLARPQKPEDRGASWFLFERRNEHQAIAEAVAPVIYGTQIDCAQCHDHPLAREIKQGHYWGLVAAYNRSKNVDGTTEVAESAVGGHVNFTNLKKESQPAVIALLNGKTLEEIRPVAGEKEEDSDDKYVDPKAKARVPKYSRRAAFAEAVTQDNPLLARAFVNRMWAVLLGRGIVHPADQMNARNAPSHPELLAWLARDFADSGYDVRRLIRGVVLSQVYGLSLSSAFPPETFAGAAERPLTAEQLARSWRIAAGLPAQDDALRRAAVAALPDVLPLEYHATFQQAQFLAHSPALAEILQPASGNTVARLAEAPSSESKVREAFAAAYQREPDAEELQQTRAFLEARADRPAESARDLLWALLTSAEFLTMP